MSFLFATPAGTPALTRTNESAWVQRHATSAVFSSREQMHSSFERREIGKIESPARGQRIRITHLGNQELPEWFVPVFESLEARWGWEIGWDGYDALPTDAKRVAELLNCLALAMPLSARAPTITPLADGGVQAEWHKGETVLEIVVPRDEPARFYFYGSEENREEAASFPDSLPLLRELIGRF